MNRKFKASILILLFILELNATPYTFKSAGGKNFLVIDDEYLESKKEAANRRHKKQQLLKARRRKAKRQERKLNKLRQKEKRLGI